jgi:hypothetical protein
MQDIRNKINSLDNVKLQAILQKRYLNYQKWEQIALDMNYHINHIWRLHKKALKFLNML